MEFKKLINKAVVEKYVNNKYHIKAIVVLLNNSKYVEYNLQTQIVLFSLYTKYIF